MPEPTEFQYALLRLVPDIARGERINVAVVLFCRRRDFLDVRVHVDPARLAALSPAVDVGEVLAHLRALSAVAVGDPAGGPVASLPASERFGWLVAPASTVIRPSAVHTGVTGDCAATLQRLYATLVA